MLEGYRYISRFRTTFGDLDMMQHVNHGSYVRWAEAIRTDYFTELFGDVVNGDRGMILVRMEFVYERQLRLRENIAIGCRVSRIGTRSFDFTYDIVSEDAQARSAMGVTTMVAYDYTNDKSISVPQNWRERITEYEILQPGGTGIS